MKETINYKITETKEIKKTFECDVKNVFLSFKKSGYTCYFGSFEYFDDNYSKEIYRDDLRVLQITILKDKILYYSSQKNDQGRCFTIKNIFEDHKNIKEISRDQFFKELKRLPFYQLNKQL